MKRSSHLALPIAACVAIFAAGCNSTGCLDNRSSLLLAGFYSAEKDNAIALKNIEIGGIGAPDDSLLIDKSQTPSEVYLPLRHTATSTSFVIRYLDELIDLSSNYDTISLTYTTIPYFASEECGAVYHYAIKSLDYTRHYIDSIALLDSVINNTDMQKMHIYFLTD